jgi:hypothetical protein
LNCVPVGTIQSSASATFEIQFQLPSGLDAGTYKLWWILADGRLESPGASTELTIT